jgi:hypothetical protein
MSAVPPIATVHGMCVRIDPIDKSGLTAPLRPTFRAEGIKCQISTTRYWLPHINVPLAICLWARSERKKHREVMPAAPGEKAAEGSAAGCRVLVGPRSTPDWTVAQG